MSIEKCKLVWCWCWIQYACLYLWSWGKMNYCFTWCPYLKSEFSVIVQTGVNFNLVVRKVMAFWPLFCHCWQLLFISASNVVWYAWIETIMEWSSEFDTSMTDPLVPMSLVPVIAASKAGVTASVSFLWSALPGAEIGH